MASQQADTDVGRTLKFIGRLAVRLQTGGTTSLSKQSLQKALKEAVLGLPEGVVKQTLVSDPDRFARALVDRVSSLGAVTIDVKRPVEDLLSKGLLSDRDYESAVSDLVGENAEGKEQLEKWRELAWKILAAREAVPDTAIAALFKLETALGRDKVLVGREDAGTEASSKVAILEEVTSSCLLRSACLAANSRLLLLPPLVSFLEDAVQILAKLDHARSQAKRLESISRSLLAVHSSLSTREGGRSGASLLVALVVTKYLVLKKAGRVGEAALEKLRRAASLAQAVVSVGEKGALIDALCSEEESLISSLHEDGAYAVRGALYEAALRRIPFEREDASPLAWLRRIALARKATKMFRANGDRSRATAMSKAVLKFGFPDNLAAIAPPQRETLLPFVPSEGLLNDPRGLTSWLASSADDNAFAAVRDVLLSRESASTSSIEAERNVETGLQEEAGSDEAEPLFYIDRTGGTVDPAEEAMITAAETMRQATASGLLAEEGRSEDNELSEDETAKGAEPNKGQERKNERAERSKGAVKKLRKKGQDGGESTSGSSEESGSSDSDMDEDEFIRRMPSRPLDASSDSEPEPSKRKGRNALEQAPIGTPVGLPAEGDNDNEAAKPSATVSANGGGRKDRASEEPSGNELPKIAVKKQGLGVLFDERDELSPLHTRSGRSVASPGPSSVSKKGLRGLGKRKEALTTVSELTGEGSAAKRGKDAVEVEGGTEQKSLSKTPRKFLVGGAGKSTLKEEASQLKERIEKVPTTANKGKKVLEAIGDEDHVSPLHTRSGKALAVPSTLKKTATKKRGAVEKVADGGAEGISPLHTRSGKVVVATPVTVKKTNGTQTLASSSKRSRNV